MEDIRSGVKKVMSKVLKVPAETISDESSTETLPNWDSLAHLNLVLALEQEFKVSFSTDEILQMMNIRNVIEIIGSKAGNH